jgi:formylglycine-generating enzyme required for sulfatase activity
VSEGRLSSLRALARDYADGRITREAYRVERTRMLDRMTGAADLLPPPVVEGAAEDAEPAAPSGDREATEPLVPPAVTPLTPAARPSRAWAWAVLAGLVTLGVAIGGWLALREGAPPGPVAPAPRVPIAVSVDVTAEPEARALALLDGLDGPEAWSSETLARFTGDWRGLDDATRARAAGTDGYWRVAARVRERLSEELALLDIGWEGSEAADYRALVDLAWALGLPEAEELAAVEAATLAASATAVEAPAQPPGAAVGVPPEPAQVSPPAGTAVPLASEAPAVASRAPSPSPSPSTAPAGLLAEGAIPVPPPRPEAGQPPGPQGTERPVAGATGAGRATSGAARPGPAAGANGECHASLLRTRRPYCRDLLPGGGAGPLLVVLPEGSFTMGGTRSPAEQPPHAVTLARPFAMSVFEVAHSEYQPFCRETGRGCPAPLRPGVDDPVVGVSRQDAQAYTQWLSKATGQRYRLPSEAEWEYAARAGSTSEYPSGDEILPSDARYASDSPLAAHDRSVNRNRFRLYHMLGNVREWVADGWHGDYQGGAPADGRARPAEGRSQGVVRGGSYADDASRLRPAARTPVDPGERDSRTGFRVVRELGD